jgi:nucleoid-associated protein YgaU
MKTGLLTIFAVAISAVLTSGSPFASEPSAPDADAAEVAADPADAEFAPVAAAPAPESTGVDSGVADAGESAETATAADASQPEAAASVESTAVEATAEAESISAESEPVAANDEAAIDSELPDAGAEIAEAQAPAETDADATSEVAVEAAEAAPKVALGEVGYDEQGRSGRIHLVVPGDTLWDISDAYLGTPWVWPSVWTDNREIENPHLIVPGDRIWISAYEMRRVSAEEAERLLAGRPGSTDSEGESTGPASDSFQSLFQDDGAPNTVRVSSRETSGLVTAEQLEAAASIVDAIPDRVMLAQNDRVYIGLGEDEVSVGDQFTVFRTQEKVFDPDTDRLLGYHVNLLGWVEVVETAPEASMARVRMSGGEMELGDRVMPREKPVLDVEVLASPKNVDGRISYFPSSRVLMGTTDYVYLNRGELDGLQVGSPLEVYRAGWEAPEPARNTRVDVPDHVIAKLLVVRAQSQSSVALIQHTETELELGDHFRGAAEYRGGSE